MYQTYRSVWYRYWCRTELTEVSGTGIDVVPNLPKCPVPVLTSLPVPAVPVSISCRTFQYRYWCHTEPTAVSGTGINDVTNLATCPVPVLMSYRTYRSFRNWYWCTGTGTGTDLGTCNGGICTEHTRYFTAIPAYAVICILFKRYPLEYHLKKN